MWAFSHNGAEWPIRFPMNAKTGIAALVAALLLPFALGAVAPSSGFGSGRAGPSFTADPTLGLVNVDANDRDPDSAVQRDDVGMVSEAGTLALCAAGMLGLLVAGSSTRIRGERTELRAPGLTQMRRPASR